MTKIETVIEVYESWEELPVDEASMKDLSSQIRTEEELAALKYKAANPGLLWKRRRLQVERRAARNAAIRRFLKRLTAAAKALAN